MKLSSRPDHSKLTDEEIRALAQPTINILTWMSQITVYPDDSQHSVSTAYQMIEEILECMMLVDYVVMASVTVNANELPYDVAVKTIHDSPFVSFKVTFRIQP